MSQRINHQPAFLLSSVPWRESSLRIEIFSQDHGRVALIARSARKPQSQLRGILVPFVPVALSWYGQNDVRILHRAQWLGGWQQPTGTALISALYIHELVLKLTAYHDPEPRIFHALSHVMKALSTHANISAALRIFEWQLLRAIGFAPDIEHDDQNQTIDENALYSMQAEQTPQRTNNTDGLTVHGYTLKSLTNSQFNQPNALKEALQLNRMLLNYRLPENIHSRKLLQQIALFSTQSTE